MENTQLSKTRKLVESALMIAVATVLSLLKIADLPYGGSVTIASMLPIVLIAYRSGLLWGLGTGLAYGVLQQLLGLKNLSYFTTWQSILAIILLDYLIAFAMIGFAGVFRGAIKRQNAALAAGSLLACVLRYICHVISGATVWAGLSIPDSAALAYSLIYNATYMLPETIVLVAVTYYLGSILDFRREQPTRLARENAGDPRADALGVFAGVIILGAIIFDVARVFLHLQDGETGEFNITLLKTETFTGGFWFAVVIVTAVCAAAATTALLVRRAILKRQTAQ